MATWVRFRDSHDQRASSNDAKALPDGSDSVLDVPEDYLLPGRGLDVRFGEQEGLPDDDGVTDRNDARYDVFRSRWIFLGRYFEDWFSTAEFENLAASSHVDVRFDCFHVRLPVTTEKSPAVDAYVQRLRDATELVARMLRVDVAAWQFVKKAGKFAFQNFHASSYDPQELEPKMKFIVDSSRGETDQSAAIQRLRFMLFECDRDANADRRGGVDGVNFFKNRARIHDLDTENKLRRGWKIPIALRFWPLAPTDATGVEPLRVYLRRAIALIKDLLAKGHDETSAFVFRLVEVELRLYTTRASDVMEQLRELKSLGVAVKIVMQHSHSEPFRIEFAHLGPRDNVYPLLADAARDSHQRGVEGNLSFKQFSILSSPQLLSAVAASSTLTQLSLDFYRSGNNGVAPAQAKWLAYAIRMNRGLQELETRFIEVTDESLNAMQAVMEAADPARLLKESKEAPVSASSLPQFVTLKPTAMVTPCVDTRRRAHSYQPPRSLSLLNVPLDSEFAVVSTNATPASVEFVVPGHGVCSAAETDVASFRSANASDRVKGDCQLKTLHLEGKSHAAGLAPRFLQLFGGSVQDLRCSMLGHKVRAAQGNQQDLSAILSACPQLTSFSLEGAALSSLGPITQHLQSRACKIRSLALLGVSLPPRAVLQFFATLSNPNSIVARKLEKLYLSNQSMPLNAEAADAALRMLATNRVLRHVTLCVEDRVRVSHKARFEAAASVSFRIAPRAAALGLLSVHRHHGDDALGRLDSRCLDLIFQFAAERVHRRVVVSVSEY